MNKKICAILLAALTAVPAATYAQARQAVPPKTPEQESPLDLTGYWVSVVTEDWRWRMVPPAKGDYASVPLNRAAKDAADGWDPAKDEAAGEQCRSYGAPAIMRIPERIHISWQDDNTLKVEIDAGQQTRLFHFGDWKPPANSPAGWQGDSVAIWEIARGARGAGPASASAETPHFGDLKVTTTHMRPGYLRKNGIPYSAQASMTEFWDVSTQKYLTGPHHDEPWLVITTEVHDPAYLQEDWITSLHFKKEADGSKWDPQPCSARW